MATNIVTFDTFHKIDIPRPGLSAFAGKGHPLASRRRRSIIRSDDARTRWPPPDSTPGNTGTLAAVLLVGSLLALGEPPLAIFLGVVGLVALFAGASKLLVGPRYLLCGNEIVYFANVDRVDRDEIAGTLRLTGSDGRGICLERD